MYMRIVYDNLVDHQGVSLSASSTAGGLVASNLKNNRKGLIWRSAGTSATLTLNLPTDEFVSFVGLAFCNLTSEAMIRVQVLDGASTVYDSGQVLACPPGILGDLAWGAEPLGVNHYSYSEQQVYGYHWLPEVVTGRNVVVELFDQNNPSGYLEGARLIVGSHWEPEITADLGVVLGVSDGGRTSRTDSGDIVTALGPRSKTLSFSLSALLPSEGQRLRAMLLGAGQNKPIFASLYPENSDPAKEQAFHLLGKQGKTSTLKLTHFNNSASSIEIEEL
jgi:hypothetical protein